HFRKSLLKGSESLYRLGSTQKEDGIQTKSILSIRIYSRYKISLKGLNHHNRACSDHGNWQVQILIREIDFPSIIKLKVGTRDIYTMEVLRKGFIKMELY